MLETMRASRRCVLVDQVCFAERTIDCVYKSSEVRRGNEWGKNDRCAFQGIRQLIKRIDDRASLDWEDLKWFEIPQSASSGVEAGQSRTSSRLHPATRKVHTSELMHIISC